jgi:D-sedoheptulose 7-phosphate isomerase
MKKTISDYINNTAETINGLKGLYDNIETAGQLLVDTFKEGKKLIIFGNGGSAADAQHIAAELVSRFRKERDALPAIALSTNTSSMTAIGNDYDFDCIFTRQLDALSSEGDIVIAISTSGNSKNVVRAAVRAKEKNLKVVAMTGASGGELSKHSDVLLNIPSTVTSHIQEGHITVYHLLCHIIEEELF